MNVMSFLSSIPPGAALGFIGVIVGNAFRLWLKQRTRRSRLRAGFLAEVKVPKSAINDLAEFNSVTQGDVDYSTIPRELYESQSSEIGILTAEEVNKIVEYYSLAAVAKEQIEAISNGEPVSNFDQIREELKEARNDAEEALKNHS